jgi:cysteine desulfurase
LKRIYLDNNATTPIHPEVFDAMLPYLKDEFGNPSSLHQYGRSVRVKIDKARESVAALINADPREIVFTSGGSESDNLAIKGLIAGRGSKGHIITTVIEHPAVLSTCAYLERHGIEVTYLPVDEHGIVSPERVKQSIKNETQLISIHHSNNEIGTVEPIEEIISIARERGVPLHTDAVQSVGKIPIDVKKMGIDLLSISAHKINGPKGVGALFIRNGLKGMHPILHGGSQEKKRRAGTENTVGLIGFGKACEIAVEDMGSKSSNMLKLRNRLEKEIFEKIPHVKLNGHPEKRLPSTLNVSFKFVEGESLLINLDLAGICVSTGSACSSGSLEPSHVLVAMGIPHETVHGSLRFSFGYGNGDDDVNYLMEKLPAIVKRVREMSPLWDE